MKRKTLYNFNSVQLTFNQCVFNRIQYRLNTICTVRDSTIWIEWKVQHEVFNSTRRGEWKFNTDCL